jgi:hypothetical protein
MKENPIVGQGTSLQAWRSSRHLAELPLIDAQTLVPAGSRAVIIAPHPDDEVLGCGGLLQLLAALERPILIISVTDGSASHPAWFARRKARRRCTGSACRCTACNGFAVASSTALWRAKSSA